MEVKNIQVKIQVDTTELESAIEKIERFIALSQEAQNSLQGINH